MQLPNKLDSAEIYLLEAEKLSKDNSDIVFIVAKMYELTDRKPTAVQRLHSIINNRIDHVLSLYQLSEFYRAPSEDQDLNIFDKEPKGELTIVISDKKMIKKTSQILSESDKNIIKKMTNKLSTKEIAGLISEISKASKKEIYNYCLKLKNEK